MSKLHFTPDEEKVLRVYSTTPQPMRSRLLSLLGQIGLPLACAAYGVATKNNTFLGAAIGGLVGVMVARMYYQQQYADIFRKLCRKVQAHQEAEHSDLIAPVPSAD